MAMEHPPQGTSTPSGNWLMGPWGTADQACRAGGQGVVVCSVRGWRGLERREKEEGAEDQYPGGQRPSHTHPERHRGRRGQRSDQEAGAGHFYTKKAANGEPGADSLSPWIFVPCFDFSPLTYLSGRTPLCDPPFRWAKTFPVPLASEPSTPFLSLFLLLAGPKHQPHPSVSTPPLKS